MTEETAEKCSLAKDGLSKRSENLLNRTNPYHLNSSYILKISKDKYDPIHNPQVSDFRNSPFEHHFPHQRILV